MRPDPDSFISKVIDVCAALGLIALVWVLMHVAALY